MRNNFLPDNVYDVLKWVSIVCLPALSVFVLCVSKIWGWADLGTLISETITAVAVLLGSLLGISAIQYKRQNTANIEDKAE